ncbi:hypothetical protein U9M48_022436 [Paspalum notatum var. saurae]|uniref:Uncharacterized protein n=1 Tax=Paspalum notatum var. saurae TaxID=547442 RepID=A0AAQ3TM24_PASNO
MSSCYGSHVLRTLLCLCKGVPLELLQDFHTTKRSAILAERLSCGTNQASGRVPKNFTALKLSFGDDNELHHIISILLSYDEDHTVLNEDCSEKKEEIVTLLEETSSWRT